MGREKYRGREGERGRGREGEGGREVGRERGGRGREKEERDRERERERERGGERERERERGGGDDDDVINLSTHPLTSYMYEVATVVHMTQSFKLFNKNDFYTQRAGSMQSDSRKKANTRILIGLVDKPQLFHIR